MWTQGDPNGSRMLAGDRRTCDLYNARNSGTSLARIMLEHRATLRVPTAKFYPAEFRSTPSDICCAEHGFVVLHLCTMIDGWSARTEFTELIYPEGNSDG